MKKLSLLCFCAILLGFVAVFAIKRYVEPNQVYFREIGEICQKWEAKLRLQHPNIYVVCGGSSGRFGINPQILLDEFDIPLVAANGHAGFGVPANTSIAWSYLKQGDTLVLSYEDGITRGEFERCPNSGLYQALQVRGLNMFQDGIIPLNLDHLSRALRGDSQSLAKTLGQCFYPVEERFRYFRLAQTHKSGWVSVRRDEIFFASLFKHKRPESLRLYSLSHGAKDYFQKLLNLANQQGIKLIYYPPSVYAPPEEEAIRAWFYLELTRMGIPVLKVPNFNIHQRFEFTADTNLHLNAEGASYFTRCMGEALKEQRFWTEQELINELIMNGWNEDGSSRY